MAAGALGPSQKSSSAAKTAEAVNESASSRRKEGKPPRPPARAAAIDAERRARAIREQRGHSPHRLVASPGQPPTSAGHHVCASCSSSGTASAPDASHAIPTTKTSPFGVSASASTDSSTGATDHSSWSSRTIASTGCSPTSTAPAAPSVQRPVHDASQGARRPASQRPSASRTTHRTETLRVAALPTSRSDQRAGCKSSRRPSSRCSKPTSRAASPSWLGEPRSRSAASAASAAAVSAASGSNGSSIHAAVTCCGDQGPRASRRPWVEDIGEG